MPQIGSLNGGHVGFARGFSGASNAAVADCHQHGRSIFVVPTRQLTARALYRNGGRMQADACVEFSVAAICVLCSCPDQSCTFAGGLQPEPELG